MTPTTYVLRTRRKNGTVTNTVWENNLCIRNTYGNKSMTTEYYKWNSKKKEYILVPEMTAFRMGVPNDLSGHTGKFIKMP
jgi:hypothetical protein